MKHGGLQRPSGHGRGLCQAGQRGHGEQLERDGWKGMEKDDQFKCAHPKTDWMIGLDRAENIRSGRKRFELVRIE